MANEKSAVSDTIAIVSLDWKGDTIATRCACSGESVALGDAADSMAPLPAELLGAARLVIADADGGPHVRVPEGKVASIRTGAGHMRLVAGPARVALVAEEEATVLFGAFEVVVAAHAKEAGARRRRVAAGAWVHTAMVAAIHAGLLFAGSRAALASQTETEPDPHVEQMRAYLAAADERSAASDDVIGGNAGSKTEKKANGRSGNGKDGGGERHEGEAGKAGSTTSRDHKGHWGATANDAKSTAASAAEDLEAARTFGLVSVLTAMNGDTAQRDSVGAPLRQSDSPWGSDDAFAAMGGMLGRSVGESEGVGGLSLTGIGEGGGGLGQGIGLGGIGTIGHTDGFAGIGTGGTGSGSVGFGIGIGHWGGSHVARGPQVRWGWGCGVSVSGRLPPEIIQRIVRSNFGRFRACYEDGLKRNPALEGRVTTSFVIGRDGSVSNVADAGGDLPDAAVKSCVIRAFYGLSFPQPEGGIVTNVYPIVFSPQAASAPATPMSFTPGE
jgi:hypothetical protein